MRLSCVCERKPVQRQAGVFANRQRIVGERERDVFYGRRERRGTDGVEQNELVAQVLDHVRSDRDGELAAPVVGVDGDGPAWLDHINVELRVGPNCDLDDEVYAVRRNLRYGDCCVLAAVVDDVVGAGRGRERPLAGPEMVAMTVAPAHRASWMAA